MQFAALYYLESFLSLLSSLRLVKITNTFLKSVLPQWEITPVQAKALHSELQQMYISFKTDFCFSFCLMAYHTPMDQKNDTILT